MDKKYLLALLIAIIALAATGASAEQLLAANFEKDSVIFIDTDTDERKDIKTDDGSNRIALSPDNSLAVVTNTVAGTASVISLEKLAVLSDVTVGKDPIGAAITSDNKYAIIANSKSSSVSIIDLSTLEVTKELAVGDQPISIAVNGNNAYVTTLGDNKITVIDLTTFEIISAFSNSELLRSPGEIKITPNSKFAYVLDTRNNYIVTLDLEKGEISDNNIKTRNVNINDKLILGNQFALLSASKEDGNGVIQVIDFDKSYATILTELSEPIKSIDFQGSKLYIAKESGIEELDTLTGERKAIQIDGEISDIKIISKSETSEKPEKKALFAGLSKETIKIIVIVVVIIIILILIFWQGPKKKSEEVHATIKKSRKAKKEIKKKARRRQKAKEKKPAEKEEGQENKQPEQAS